MTRTVTDEEIAPARQAALDADAVEARAEAAHYDAGSGRLVVELRDGAVLQIPVHLLQGVAGGDAQQIVAVEIWGDGYALHWEELDADLTVPGLVAGVFGTRQWMNRLQATNGAMAAGLTLKSERERKAVAAV